ncbi:hypothetical protein D3C84_938820 [compost metagenome]
MTEIGVPEFSAQGGPQIVQHAFGRNREETSLQAPAEQVEGQVDQAVDRQEPHRREMPLQRACQPAAEGDRIGKTEIVDRRGVVDAPTAGDHHQHRQGVEPMGQA